MCRKIATLITAIFYIVCLIVLSTVTMGAEYDKCSKAPPLALKNIQFVEDFLGIKIPDRFSTSVAGDGSIGISACPSIGGWVQLLVAGPNRSVARLRLGEDPDDSHYDCLNFSTQKQARAVTRVILSRIEDLQATIGWISENDPDNVGGALVYRNANDLKKGTIKGQWLLQTVRDKVYSIVKTGWQHKPNEPFEVAINVTPKRVDAYINGKLMATSTSNIPSKPMAFEWQIWNKKPGDGYSSATMWVDVVKITQNR